MQANNIINTSHFFSLACVNVLATGQFASWVFSSWFSYYVWIITIIPGFSMPRNVWHAHWWVVEIDASNSSWTTNTSHTKNNFSIKLSRPNSSLILSAVWENISPAVPPSQNLAAGEHIPRITFNIPKIFVSTCVGVCFYLNLNMLSVVLLSCLFLEIKFSFTVNNAGMLTSKSREM